MHLAMLGGEVAAVSTRRTVKKPGLFMRWFMKKSEEAWDRSREIREQKEREMANKYDSDVLLARTPGTEIDNLGGTTFTITACDGGVLITTKYIDRTNYDQKIKRYIVPDGASVAKRIEEIFSFQALSG